MASKVESILEEIKGLTLLEASDLVTQYSANHGKALGEDHLEGVAFDLTSDGTENRQPGDSVVGARG